MPLHSGGIASEHDHGRASAAGGTDGTEYEGLLGAFIFGRQWLGYLVLLANPGLILPPDLYRRADWKRGLEQHQCVEEVF
ncbi:hypothetical protein N9F34_02680 [Alphaproteobacteria bacterium]|nr:hypothetical protein [Alphaproteobacteria bacterium]